MNSTDRKQAAESAPEDGSSDTRSNKRHQRSTSASAAVTSSRPQSDQEPVRFRGGQQVRMYPGSAPAYMDERVLIDSPQPAQMPAGVGAEVERMQRIGVNDEILLNRPRFEDPFGNILSPPGSPIGRRAHVQNEPNGRDILEEHDFQQNLQVQQQQQRAPVANMLPDPHAAGVIEENLRIPNGERPEIRRYRVANMPPHPRAARDARNDLQNPDQRGQVAGIALLGLDQFEGYLRDRNDDAVGYAVDPNNLLDPRLGNQPASVLQGVPLQPYYREAEDEERLEDDRELGFQPAPQVGHNGAHLHMDNLYDAQDLFAGLQNPEPVPDGLPYLQPGPRAEFAEVRHLHPGMIPWLSHRQRQELTRTRLFQQQNRVDILLDAGDALHEEWNWQYDEQLLGMLADREDEEDRIVAQLREDIEGGLNERMRAEQLREEREEDRDRDL
jgi:hypothetical protein